MMYPSAEIRLWWQGGPPAGVASWFEARPFAPGGGKPRTEHYLIDPSSDAIGIKRRNGSTEIKILFGRGPRAGEPPFDRPVEFWTKACSALDLDGQKLVAVEKTRRLRKFTFAANILDEIALGADERPLSGESPRSGCNVELTAVSAKRQQWTTLGLEAFGEMTELATQLRQTLLLLGPVKVADPPALAGSYPRWLRELR